MRACIMPQDCNIQRDTESKKKKKNKKQERLSKGSEKLECFKSNTFV